MTAVQEFHGRILDSDSHELAPAPLWPEIFGEVTRPFANIFSAICSPQAVNSMNADVKEDVAPINADTADAVWQAGGYAPGAFDMNRRLEVMDYFGIDRQLVFASGVGGLGFICVSDPPDLWKMALGLGDVAEAQSIGREMCKAYNDWCITNSKVSPRLRPVASIETTSMEAAIAESERVIDGGVRAAWVLHGLPPDGKSPGHPDLDPLWRVFADNQVPVIFHIGGDLTVLRSDQWSNYGFDSNMFGSGRPMDCIEINLDPYSFSTMHLGAENYLSAMVFGGVFERHPELRVGCVETGAHWVGPMAENLDNVALQFARRLSGTLSMKPSEYINRNVRVTSFFWEPVDRYMERYGLEDVYTFGTDYPHFEGGKDPLNREAAKLERLGKSAQEKYFVTNGELLLPA